MAASRLRSLFECLGEVPECRFSRDKRYPLKTVLAFATPPETLDNAIGQWAGQHGTAHAPVVMDGKDLRGASKQTEEGRRMIVAAVEHDTGVVLGQVEVGSKSNEIPAVRALSGGLDLTGRIVTVDAMHAQHETARYLLGYRADYMLSAVKDNQETILEDLKAIDWSATPWHETAPTRAMAASSDDATPPSTSPAPSETATPISMVTAKRCASNASVRYPEGWQAQHRSDL